MHSLHQPPMHYKLLRALEVCEKLSIGKSTLWYWIKEGKFPKGIKLSERVTVWKESDVDSFIAAKLNAP